MDNTVSTTRPDYPEIFDKYVETFKDSGTNEHMPRRLTRRYHQKNITVWYGRVHVDDIEGWSDNIRIRHYLGRWRTEKGDVNAVPSTKDIYELMVEADKEEKHESKRPFHIERIADNIAVNGVQEPIFLYYHNGGTSVLWDGNRRRFGTEHIMQDKKYAEFRDDAQWIPAFVYPTSGDPSIDKDVQHKVLTELNFKEKDHIPWPNYVKAEEVHRAYQNLISRDPTDSVLRGNAKRKVSNDYGLNGWRKADRWIKMYELAQQFKEYHEEEHSRDENTVDLIIQDKFEYFDELSKNGVWGPLKEDVDKRDEVFDWLFDGKFESWQQVRQIPKIFADPSALSKAREAEEKAIENAIKETIANDPTRLKDKRSANARIEQFADWLETFKPSDFKTLNADSLERLLEINATITNMLGGLLNNSTITSSIGEQ